MGFVTFEPQSSCSNRGSPARGCLVRFAIGALVKLRSCIEAILTEPLFFNRPIACSFGVSRCRFGGFAWQNLVTNILTQSLEHALSEPCLHISRLCTRWVGCGSLSIDKMPCYKLVQLALVSAARNEDPEAFAFVLNSGQLIDRMVAQAALSDGKRHVPQLLGSQSPPLLRLCSYHGTGGAALACAARPSYYCMHAISDRVAWGAPGQHACAGHYPRVGGSDGPWWRRAAPGIGADDDARACRSAMGVDRRR